MAEPKRAEEQPDTVDGFPARTVVGRAVDAQGAPVADAEVTVAVREILHGPIRADSGGRFAVDCGIPDHVVARVTVAREGLCPAVAEARPAPGVVELQVGDLVLRTGGCLTGRLTDRQGGGVAQAVLQAFGAAEPAPLAQARSGAAGGFRVGPLPAIPVRVLVLAPEHQRLELPALAPLADGEVRDLGNLVLAPGRTLVGQVHSLAGTLVAGAEVRCVDAGVATTADAQGRFELGSLPLAPVRLRARAAGYLDLEEECAAQAYQVHLRLVQGITLHGALWSQATGEPLLAARTALVRLSDQGRPVPASAAWPSLVPQATAPANGGRFSWTGLLPGKWALRATAPGHAPLWLGPIELRADSGRVERDGFLSPGRALAGTVEDARGQPVAGASVQVVEPLEMAASRVVVGAGVRFLGELGAARTEAAAVLVAEQVTDAAGGFAFAELPARTLRVVARAAGHAPSALELMAAAPGPLRFRLLAAAGVRGRVVGLTPGERNVQVVLLAGAGHCRAADVGPGGEYALDGVDPGRYLLRAVRGPAERGLHDLLARIHQNEPALLAPDLELQAGQVLERQLTVLEPLAR